MSTEIEQPTTELEEAQKSEMASAWDTREQQKARDAQTLAERQKARELATEKKELAAIEAEKEANLRAAEAIERAAQDKSWHHHQLKGLVKTSYTMQRMRIEAGNRVSASFKRAAFDAGIDPDNPASSDDAEQKSPELMAALAREHKLITEDMAAQIRGGRQRATPKLKLKGVEMIQSTLDWQTADSFFGMLEAERQAFKGIESALRTQPIYNEFLKDIKGVGPAMAGVIVASFDITRAEYPSSLWAYAGYDVAADGKARSRRKEHLIDREYVATDGQTKTKKSATYNPWLRQKLFVLGDGFLKQRTPVYREIYDNYKRRLEHSDKPVRRYKDGVVVEELTWATTTPAHRHLAAIRYMMKRFLVDLYNAWRALEGLPIAPEYSEAKLGIEHKKAS